METCIKQLHLTYTTLSQVLFLSKIVRGVACNARWQCWGLDAHIAALQVLA